MPVQRRKYSSKKQQAWAFATGQPFAKRMAHATGEGGKKTHAKGSAASKRAYAKLPAKAAKRKRS